MAMPSSPKTPVAPSDGTAPEPPSSGWFQSIRARLGLPQGPNLRETLTEAVKHRDDASGLTDAERRMIARALRFGGLRVGDIMIPRADIIAIDESLTVRELLKAFATAGVSRMPVFRDTLDDPRGMIHVKDVLKWLTGLPLNGPNGAHHHPPPAKDGSRPQPKPGALAAMLDAAAIDLTHADLGRSIASTRLVRDVKYAPDSKNAMNLLIEMQASRVHMALVVDEYGGTHGLVTIEDLIEQVMGEIEDEHDEDEATLIQRTPQGDFIVQGRVAVNKLEAQLGEKLMTEEEAEDVDTVGGLVATLAGHVPVRGELIKHASGFEFEVLDADPRRIKRLKIHAPKNKIPAAQPPAPTLPRT
ncbi:MAG: hypothetical protein RL291_869 [Pseudomonadota bacterium]